MTGFKEPGSCLVIEKRDQSNINYTLYVPPKNDNRERWDGARTGEEKAKEILKIEAAPSTDLQAIFTKKHDFIYFDPSMSMYNDEKEINHQVRNLIYTVNNGQQRTTLVSHRNILDHLRKIKSDKEVEILEKAAEISSHAFKAAMRLSKQGITEGHIEAIMEFESRLRGAQRLGYPPVVASGNRANIIHYVFNDQLLHDDDMLLVDAGCEYHNYSSDITRTWPVSGTFSQPQKIIYSAVLRIQKDCIEGLKNGVFSTMYELQTFANERTAQEVVNFGGLTNGFIFSNQSRINEIAKILCPHSIGHPMGMDIHENKPDFHEPLRPGMVITVEPGIYIPSELAMDSRLPDEWKGKGMFGIGVRIEDNVLIMPNQTAKVITHQTPKEMEEIEHVMNDEKSTYEDLSKHVIKNFNF
ncbi:Xaa-Pro aminopeptidase [Acrasis kona]|uniref:Xaa-Pro aminopeptidase n=1 Tax=Acrasis kona TaxID=1008807 RepID=A0AAW2ZBE9_9EUKA